MATTEHGRPLTGILIIVISVVLFFVLFFAIRNTENSKVIETNIGKSFAINLDSNPSTGYQWQIVKALDTGLLELVDSKYIPPETNLVGAPGKEEWTFRAIKAGKAIISFNYVRSWENNVAPAKTDYYIVMISK